MNERINVLAVMGHLAYALQHSPKAVEQINEARSAVAELIEAAREYRESSVNFYGQVMTPSVCCLGRLNTALARVGGSHE